MRLIYEKGVNGIDGTLNAKYYREFAGDSSEVESIDKSDLADGSFVVCTDSGVVQFFSEATQAWNPMFTFKGDIPATASTTAGTLSMTKSLKKATVNPAETPEPETEETTDEPAGEKSETEEETEGQSAEER